MAFDLVGPVEASSLIPLSLALVAVPTAGTATPASKKSKEISSLSTQPPQQTQQTQQTQSEHPEQLEQLEQPGFLLLAYAVGVAVVDLSSVRIATFIPRSKLRASVGSIGLDDVNNPDTDSTAVAAAGAAAGVPAPVTMALSQMSMAVALETFHPQSTTQQQQQPLCLVLRVAAIRTLGRDARTGSIVLGCWAKQQQQQQQQQQQPKIESALVHRGGRVLEDKHRQLDGDHDGKADLGAAAVGAVGVASAPGGGDGGGGGDDDGTIACVSDTGQHENRLQRPNRRSWGSGSGSDSGSGSGSGDMPSSIQVGTSVGSVDQDQSQDQECEQEAIESELELADESVYDPSRLPLQLLGGSGSKRSTLPSCSPLQLSVSAPPTQDRHKGFSVFSSTGGSSGSGSGGSGSSSSSGGGAGAAGGVVDWSAPLVDKKTKKVLDMPVTFHAKVLPFD
jgi:hypothetical protein